MPVGPRRLNPVARIESRCEPKEAPYAANLKDTMSNIRDLSNPSGADVEAFVNQQLGKLNLNLSYGKAGGGQSWMAQDYDLKVTKANEFPGMGWEYVESLNIGPALVGIVWRKSRILQAQHSEESVMRLIAPKV